MKKAITKRCLIALVLLSTTRFGYPQNPWQNRCGTIEATSSIYNQKPDTVLLADTVLVIPTVFHILTQGGAENISKSHVLRVLEELNRDFNRQNPDTLFIPQVFQALRGNPKIEFRLARLDTNGNCTDGIDRIYTPLTSTLGSFAQMQPNFSWDHTKYMNIYIAKWLDYTSEIKSALGYVAPIDSGQNLPAFNDALAVSIWALPDGYNGSTPFLEHILGHEMGHCFGLYHIWRSAGCLDDDEVNDTPIQDIANEGCPSFPHISCNNGPDGDMFTNFMDYSYCPTMFSQGQVDRMRTCLAHNEWRNSLWTPANLIATGVDTLQPVCPNPPVADFGYGNYAQWLNAGEPILFYEAAKFNPTSYQWNFTGGIPATSADTFPLVVFADSGMHQVQLIVNNSFGSDTISKMIKIAPAEVNYALNNHAMIEDFEDSLFNQQIPVFNLASTKTWKVTNTASYSNSHSMKLDSSARYISEFFTHKFDLSQLTGTGRKLQFKVALGLSPIGNLDAFLLVSWKKPHYFDFFQIVGIYGYTSPLGYYFSYNSPDSLVTAVINAPFTPTAGQWKAITVPFPDTLTGEVQLVFGWYQNNVTNKMKGLYIDDIIIGDSTTSISEMNNEINWMIYPNPSNGFATIEMSSVIKNTTLSIFNISGQRISEQQITNNKTQIDISTLPTGVYVIKLQNEKTVGVEKFIKN